MGKEEEKKEFILEDLDREGISPNDPSKGDENKNGDLRKFTDGNWGRLVLVPAGNQYTEIDLTGPPGYTSGVYYPLCFWLRRQGYQTEKADEAIEVTPMHSAYYQLTAKQKEDLEAKIKAGIASATQAVSDFELLSHDERKYREFLRYYGYRTQKELDADAKKKPPEQIPDDYDELKIDDEEEALKKRRDDHALKSFFIDQVDQHTGDVSLRNIVQRWPTIITDFLRVKDEHMDLDTIRKALNISKAESVVLLTKNKLYQEWKRMFFPEVKGRYDRIKQLILSRKKSIEEYREWVKPYVAKHQLIKESLSSSDDRKSRLTSFFAAGGHAVSTLKLTLWVWRPFQSQEYYLTPGEVLAQKKIPPDDKWTRKNLIWDKNQGLVVKYPWITKKWVDERVQEIKKDWMFEHRLYYTFTIIKFNKSNLRFPDGFELEDGVYNLNNILMSQNILLVKLLELKAKQYEFEKYINDLLGIPSDFIKGPKEQFKKEFNIKLPFNMKFFKYGPYEPTFYDRINRTYLIPMYRVVFGPIVSKIKDLAGYGKD